MAGHDHSKHEKQEQPRKAPPGPAGPCPCGSGQTFATCCDAILKQQRPAADAEQLMRSRFTAHVVRNFLHLHRTHLESSREPFVDDPEAEGQDWTRLVIHSQEPGSRPDKAFVDFSAYFREGKEERAHHEKGEFERVDGTWYYLRPVRQGPAPVKAAAGKIGRNDPCRCGSGKKFKNCCG